MIKFSSAPTNSSKMHMKRLPETASQLSLLILSLIKISLSFSWSTYLFSFESKIPTFLKQPSMHLSVIFLHDEHSIWMKLRMVNFNLFFEEHFISIAARIWWTKVLLYCTFTQLIKFKFMGRRVLVQNVGKNWTFKLLKVGRSCECPYKG